MSEGADTDPGTRPISENSRQTTLKKEDKPDVQREAKAPPQPPPRANPTNFRRARFGTSGGTPPSPWLLIDGKQIRSALAFTKKWPPRRVSFPSNDTLLVTGYLEPANPWEHAENVSHQELVSSYKESCARHGTEPIESVIHQLENLDITEDERSEELCIKGELLDQNHCEPLEEILKRVQFNKIDLEECSLNDESSVILFDMLEYYESAKHLNISHNHDIGPRGWQACSHMIKKTHCLEQLDAKDVTLSEKHMTIFCRAIRQVAHLHILKLENCRLSGRPLTILVTALKLNLGIRELYLADNDFDRYDAVQLASLLRLNSHLQLLDISNNNIQDEGARDIFDGLINQVREDKECKGLGILVLWNNHLTHRLADHLARIISSSKTLETLNIGQNALLNETLDIIKEPLKQNRALLQLGMQSTNVTCPTAYALAEVLEHNKVLQRIDLRDNVFQARGITFLLNAMKKNKSVTQLDLDDKPREKIDCKLHQYMDMVKEIREYCARNSELSSSDESTESTNSSPQHRSRLSSVSSRKISLTCQTLPRTPPSVANQVPGADNATTRTMLEPKRSSGGRLRSPAPSPIPSPIASPIPSPSRSRFVVSRVPESSLSSTNSSASSSPITSPSLGSSPTCFFPSTDRSSTSRFRVTTIVESNLHISAENKSVVTSANNTNITIGFDFRLDEPSALELQRTVEVDEEEEEEEEEEEKEIQEIEEVRVGEEVDDERNTDDVFLPENETSRPPSSLEKLLGLFQHPGSFFASDASDGKVNIQESVYGRFQRYLHKEMNSTTNATPSPSPLPAPATPPKLDSIKNHQESTDVKLSNGNKDTKDTFFDKSTADDLIFNITDIAANIEESTTYYPTAPRSPTNLLIEKSRNVHRNSQDSGIEESSDVVQPESNQSASFQESLDSGIDSECSSICTNNGTGTTLLSSPRISCEPPGPQIAVVLIAAEGNEATVLASTSPE